MAMKISKDERCANTLNLPEKLEEALLRKGGLDGLKKLIPNRNDLQREAVTFQALSDPIRLQILHAMNIIDLCPCLLKEITGLSDSKLSYHLRILEETKLIASLPEKKWRIYTLTEQGRHLLGD
jgi:DNA-binding transcriptional ArsR family regulator